MDNRILPIPDSRLQQAASVWLSVEQIRKQQRMRRERVIEAMEFGELPYERRGRIRYARLSDVIAWEERRLRKISTNTASDRRIRPELSDLV